MAHYPSPSVPGAVRLGDLATVGVTPRTAARRVARGTWCRPAPGVVITDAAPSLLSLAQAAVLHGGDGAVLTGLAACRAVGMRWLPASQRCQVLVPAERRRRSTPYVLVRRAADLPELDTWTWHGLSVALPSRCVVDAARELATLRDVRGVVLGAVQDGHADVTELRRILDAGAVGGSAFCRRAVLDASRGCASPPEAELVDALRGCGRPFAVNPDVVVDGRLLGRPDVLLLDSGAAGEVDSIEHHGDAAALASTLRRHEAWSDAGFRLVHRTPAELRADPAEVVAALLGAAARTPPPKGLAVRLRGPVLR